MTIRHSAGETQFNCITLVQTLQILLDSPRYSCKIIDVVRKDYVL